jgi:hypothetical protein
MLLIQAEALHFCQAALRVPRKVRTNHTADTQARKTLTSIERAPK